MSQTHLPSHWIEKVMVLLSIPGWTSGRFYHQIVRFFTAWARAEGGHATWNPLNTTEKITDSWGRWQNEDYNSTGVSNFEEPWKGIVATAATLLESTTFIAIVEALRVAETNGKTAEELVHDLASQIHMWGTNPSTMLELLKEIS